MTSDKKTEANRRNALKSTGPKTLEGKAAVRLKALRHGLLSQEMLLPGEDEEALIKGAGRAPERRTAARRRAGEPSSRTEYRLVLEAPSSRPGRGRYVRLGALWGVGKA